MFYLWHVQRVWQVQYLRTGAMHMTYTGVIGARSEQVLYMRQVI